MLLGNEIKEFLIGNLENPQLDKSSHWEQYLQGFSYNEKIGFTGIGGFGTRTHDKVKIKLYSRIHDILQLPYIYKLKNTKNLHNILAKGKSVANAQNRIFDLDVLRQALTVAFCSSMVPEFYSTNKLNVVIGDGLGSLSSLIYLCTDNKIVSINLNEILLVDYIYTRGIFSDMNTALVTTEADTRKAFEDSNIRLIYIQAQNHSFLRVLPIHFVYNIASMQEMDPITIEQYFDDIRNCESRVINFYCCNRLEKILPDGTVSRFFDYPWGRDDIIIKDELCPWHQYYYSKSPPYYHRYDGPTQHRLVRFNSFH